MGAAGTPGQRDSRPTSATRSWSRSCATSSTLQITEPAKSGVLLCDKPAGVTSHDVVEQVRRELGVKAGHAGTLDPFATGLLVVLLGRATRLQRYMVGLSKTYRATARLGWRSSTGDPDGELTETGLIPPRLTLPTGEIEQRPPMTSAVKIGGERLYHKARRGEDVERPTRTVTIYRAELLESDDGRATFEIDCSSGTYIRTLLETLGDAYCEQLRRTAVGPFKIEQSGEQLSLSSALSFLPERELTSEEADGVRNGVPVALAPSADLKSAGAGETSGGEAGAVRIGDAAAVPAVRLTHQGGLLAVAREQEETLRPEVVLG